MKSYSQFISEARKPGTPEEHISSAWERKHPGLKLHVRPSVSKDTSIIHSIEVPKHLRRRGIGTRIMKGITNYADKTSKRLALTPAPEPRYKQKLDIFYKKHGFRSNKGRNKDFAISHSMIRNPSA